MNTRLTVKEREALNELDSGRQFPNSYGAMFTGQERTLRRLQGRGLVEPRNDGWKITEQGKAAIQ